MGRRRNSSVNVLFGWVRKQSMKVKTFLGVASALSSLLALKFLVKDRKHFFVASEVIHVFGIMVLIYKLATQKTCSGNCFLGFCLFLSLELGSGFCFDFVWFFVD